jgi:hypothetical protein
MTRDIENNVDEVETPEFTMEDVNEIDMNYKIHMSELILFEREEEMSLQEMHTSFVLNELFIEHLDYMQKLREMVTEYMNVDKKHERIRMYFQDITPLIRSDKDNLQEVRTIKK